MSGVRLTILSEGKRSLVSSTASIQQQLDYSGDVRESVLKGMSLGNSATLEESEDFSREVLANGAAHLGIRLTSSNLENLLHGSLDDALSANLEDLSNLSADAFSISSLEAMAGSNPTEDAISLLTSTKSMLADGKITAAELAQVSVSAAKTSGSVLAMATGSLAMGPLGAITAIPMVGIGFLQSEIADQEFRKQQATLQAQREIAQEASIVGAYLSDTGRQYENVKNKVVWRSADRVVSDMAELWNRCERELGVAFDLRYFKGEAPPPKGGLWTIDPMSVSNPCVRANVPACGQLYFPRPPVFETENVIDRSVSWVQYDIDLKKRGLFRSPCSSGYPYRKTDLKEPEYSYYGYQFYKKSIRALNSLLPASSTDSFWVPEEDLKRITASDWTDYSSLVFDEFYERHKRSGTQPPLNNSQAMQMYEQLLANINMGRGGTKPDIAARAVKWVSNQFDSLKTEVELLQSYKLRIFIDIMQTASAVRGEIEVAKKLRASGALEQPMSTLSQADKRSIRFEMPKMTGGLDQAALLIGLGVACFGGWKYWRARG